MERYNSGSSLSRTGKEERIDYLEGMVGEFSDELYVGLKKLSIPQLKELHKSIAERLNGVETKE